MLLHAERADILAALDRCAAAAESGHQERAHHPCLGKTLLTASAESNVLQLYANDLWVSIDVAVNAQVEAEGSIGVSTKQLASVVHALPEGIVRIFHEKGKLSISGQGRRKSQLPVVDADIFPTAPEPSPDSPRFAIQSHILRPLLSSVKAAMAGKSQDAAARAHLQAIRLEVLDEVATAVATDSYRLALRPAPAPGIRNFEISIPRALVGVIEHMASESPTVSICFTGRSLCLETEDCLVTSLVPETQFPPWRMMVANTVGLPACTVQRDLLLEAVRGVMAAKTSGGTILLELHEPLDMMRVSLSQDDSSAEDQVQVTKGERTIRVEYEPAYLVDALKPAGEQVALKVVSAGGLDALTFESADGYLSWVSPIAPK